MPDLYPGAIWRPSVINHPMRTSTWGCTIHWTVGRESGDITVLDGPSVDCHFYVAKDGDVYQFLDPDSMAWTAKHLANTYCVQIETEGRGEAWTPAQLREMGKLGAWIARRYGIPVRKVDPDSLDGGDDWAGFFGHRDLSDDPSINGNNHTDTVPADTGWSRFLQEVRDNMEPPAPDPEMPPSNATPYELVKQAMVFAQQARGRTQSVMDHDYDTDEEHDAALMGAKVADQSCLNYLALARDKLST